MITGTHDVGDRTATVIDGSGNVTYEQRPDRQISISQSSVNGSKWEQHPYSYTVYDTNSAIGYIKQNVITDGRLWGLREGNLNGAVMWLHAGNPWDASNVINDATADLISKIRQSDFNLPVALGELKETMSLGKDIWSLTKKFASRLPPARVISMGSKLLSEAWLTYSYGVKPLISDIQAIVALQPRETYHLKIKVVRKRRISYDEMSVDNANNPIRVKANGVIGHKYSVLVDVAQPVADIADRVNLFNPLLVGWELIPFSFVVDQFVNIGQTLDILGSGISMSNALIRGTRTTFRRTDQVVTCYFTKESAPFVVETNYTAAAKYRSCERTLMTGLPVPERPRLEIPTGSNFLLSSAALLRIVLLGHR